MRPKVCVECGSTFTPNSGIQKRCSACRQARSPSDTIFQGERQRESAVRKRARETDAKVALGIDDRLRQISQNSYDRFHEDDEA